jgi:hypothetical protein
VDPLGDAAVGRPARFLDGFSQLLADGARMERGSRWKAERTVSHAISSFSWRLPDRLRWFWTRVSNTFRPAFEKCDMKSRIKIGI